jgi:H2-forming N5,N10-methylenetetrahydromethanopterin dehydrogenase-like enzyme
VAELLEAVGDLASVGVVVVLVGFAAYWAFGPQVLGLPTLIGLFTLWGATSLVSNAGIGPAGAVLVVAGVLGVLLIIGMAMRLGADASTRTDSERSREDS